MLTQEFVSRETTELCYVATDNDELCYVVTDNVMMSCINCARRNLLVIVNVVKGTKLF